MEGIRDFCALSPKHSRGRQIRAYLNFRDRLRPEPRRKKSQQMADVSSQRPYLLEEDLVGGRWQVLDPLPVPFCRVPGKQARDLQTESGMRPLGSAGARAARAGELRDAQGPSHSEVKFRSHKAPQKTPRISKPFQSPDLSLETKDLAGVRQGQGLG